MKQGEKGKATVKRRDGLKRQADILDVALELFAEKGYHATQLDDIIRVSDIAKGTFYLHFKNKEDLLVMLMERHINLLFELIKLLDISRQDSIGHIREIYLSIAGQLTSNKELRLFMRFILRDAPVLPPEVSAQVQTFNDRIVDLSSYYLTRAQESGRVNGALDPRTVSQCITGSIKEILFRWLVLGESIDIDVAVRTALDLFLNGMLLVKE